MTQKPLIITPNRVCDRVKFNTVSLGAQLYLTFRNDDDDDDDDDDGDDNDFA